MNQFEQDIITRYQEKLAYLADSEMEKIATPLSHKLRQRNAFRKLIEQADKIEYESANPSLRVNKLPWLTRNALARVNDKIERQRDLKLVKDKIFDNPLANWGREKLEYRYGSGNKRPKNFRDPETPNLDQIQHIIDVESLPRKQFEHEAWFGGQRKGFQDSADRLQAKLDEGWNTDGINIREKVRDTIADPSSPPDWFPKETVTEPQVNSSVDTPSFLGKLKKLLGF